MRRALPLVFASALSLGALATFASRPARADGVLPARATPVQREQAQALFARGKERMAHQNYDAALVAFRASHEVVASPNTRLEMARCLRAGGKLVAAYAEYGRAGVEAKELRGEDNRYDRTYDAATAERAELEPRLGFVSLTITNATDATRVTVGGEEIRRAAWTEAAPIAAGTAPVVVETPGHATIERSVTLGPGGRASLAIDAQSGEPVASAETRAPTEPLEDHASKRPLRTWAYVAGGAGVAGLVSFVVFGAMARATYGDLQTACGTGPCPPSRADDISTGKSRQTIANVSLALGVGGVGAGVALFVLSRPKASSSPSAALVIAPSWLGVRGTL